MLRYAIIVLVAISFMMVPAFADIELTPQTSGVSEHLNSVFMVDSTHVWAVGNDGVIISSDGGTTWSERTRFNDNLNAVFFTDENTGHIVGDTSSGNGVIRHTVDGGGQWLGAGNTDTTSNVNDVFYIDTLNGWIVGDAGFIAETMNGGVGWNIITDFPSTTDIKSVFFTDVNNGWVIVGSDIYHTTDGGDIWSSVDLGTDDLHDVFFINQSVGFTVGFDDIFKSTDGGETWLDTEVTSGIELFSVHFMDENTGVVVGQEGHILYTEDAGDTWVLDTSIDDDLNDVYFIDENNGFVVGDGGYLASFTLGDDEPVEDTTPPIITVSNSNPYVIEVFGNYDEPGVTCFDAVDQDLSDRIVSNSTAVTTNVVGEYVVSYDCVDNSENSAITEFRDVIVEDTTPPEITLNGDSNVTIVQGTLYRDPGAICEDNYDDEKEVVDIINNIIAETPGIYQIFYDCADSSGNDANQKIRTVTVSDKPVITLVGDVIQVINQFDEYVELGATCASIEETGLTVIIDDDDVDTDIVGQHYVYYNCEDSFGTPANTAARTVQVMPLEVEITENLTDVSFITIQHGWAVGGGSIFETLDSGVTWFEFPISETQSINSISVIDENNIWAVGTGGLVVKTSNGGNTWEPISMGIESNMADVFFIDVNNGALTAGTTLYTTDNGGDTWRSDNTGDTLNSVFISSALHGFAVGDNGITATIVSAGSVGYGSIFDNNLNDVFMIDDDTIISVGDDGWIYTTDFGRNWVGAQISDDNLNAVFAIDENNIIVAGDDGWVYATDGTGIWSSAKISENNLNAISVIDDNVIVVGDAGAIIPLSISETGKFLISTIESEVETVKKKSGGGCNDCTPPTLGLDKNHKRLVDYGFAYNGNATQVEHFYTPYPLINATVGEMNLVEIIAYENGGINNMRWVQFGLGAEEIGSPLSTLEVLIEVHLVTNGTDIGVAVDEIVIHDKNNLIDNDTVAAVAYAVTCQDSDDTPRCVKVDLNYSYREETFNHVMVVDVADKRHNSQSFYFNDGVKVLGESLNVPLTFIMGNKQTSQQTESLHLTLTRTDKINHIWSDEFGVQYLQISENRFDRLTPNEKYSCANDELVIKVSAKRNNICQFMPILNYEIARAEHVMNGIMTSNNYEAIQQWDHNNRALRQYEAPQ